MEITVLIENTSDSELVREHGLSFYIAFEGKQYLLDAGSTGAFLENAKKLNIPLAEVDDCILSHGHYDHGGGFAEYLKQYGRKEAAEEAAEKKTELKKMAPGRMIPVYAMGSVLDSFYSNSGGELHEIGVPQEVRQYREQFRFIREKTQIAEHVWLLPHSTRGLECIGERAGLFRKCGDEICPDDFAHELSLVFDTEDGLVIFNSCSHSGIIPILEEVKSSFPGKKKRAFLGGLHMKGKRDGKEICTFSREEIREIAEYLKREGLQKLYTGHCTGQAGFELLQTFLGEGVERLVTGKRVSL